MVQSHANYKLEMEGAAKAFNEKPSAGIDRLILSKKCNGDPDDIARFLLKVR